jgi:GNAT superfamily N-acetyltransferase
MLERAGLVFAEAETAMAADLSDLAEIPAPADLRIERVRSLAALNAFAEVNAANWSPPDPAVLAFYERGALVLQERDCPLHLYVAYHDSQAVATAEVVVSGRIAGLYNVATRAEYRRRGIGMSMTFTVLAEARRAGAALGVLQASNEGVGVYEKVGLSAFGEYREFKPPLAGR